MPTYLVIVAMYGVVLGWLLIAFSFLFWAIQCLYRCVVDYTVRRRLKYERDGIASALHTLDRWCSYDFPIIEDIKEFLLPIIADGKTCSGISDFRDMLRAKYGKRRDN